MAEIRGLPGGRWKDYRALRLESLKTEPTAFGSSFEEEVSLPEEEWRRRIETVLFAMDGDTPVGMISYVVSNRVKTRHVAHIYGFYVKPELRGRGTGGALLKAALGRIREHGGVVKVQLSVNPDMLPAVKLYEDEGFALGMRASKELLVEGEYCDALYMEKVF